MSAETNQPVKDEEVLERETVTPSSVDQYPTGWKLGVIILPLCLGILLVAIDNTIIAVAIPKISIVFKALDDIGWYASAYLLTETALQPTFGNFYKYFDVKSVYLVSMVVLKWARFSAQQHQIRQLSFLAEQLLEQGLLGYTRGRFVSAHFPCLSKNERYILGLCNLPVGAFNFILSIVFLRLRDMRNEDRRLSLWAKITSMDFIGATFLIAATCCLLLALQWGGTTIAWKSSRIIGLFVGASLLLMLFILRQMKIGERATIPLRIIRQRSVMMGSCYIFFINMSNYIDGFYIPFYFQAVQSVSATKSGIRFVPLAFPEMVALFVVGAFVSKLGHFVPFMILGPIIGAVGTGLLTRIALGTPATQWATYLVITGIGIGTGVNLPYTALQVVLSERDVPVGNAIVIFFSKLGGAIAVPMGNTILINGLLREIPRSTGAISPQAVIKAGPTELQRLTTDPIILRALQSSYSKAIQNIMFFALAAIALSLPFAIGMEWKKLPRSTPGKPEKVQQSDDAEPKECTTPAKSTIVSAEASQKEAS